MKFYGWLLLLAFCTTPLFAQFQSVQSINGIYFADRYSSIQAAVTAAGTTGSVIIPSIYTGSDSYVNLNNIQITDLRTAKFGVVGLVSSCKPSSTGSGDICGQILDKSGANLFKCTQDGVCTFGTGTTGLTTFSVATITTLHAGSLDVTSGVSADSAGHKHKRFGATCNTGTTQFNTCNTAYTWTTTFANSSYTVSCMLDGPINSSLPVISSISSKTAAGFTLTIVKLDAAAVAAGATVTECIADHD